ncbi:MAG: HNH endonuclease [Reyranella sp.]|uniref:HNH endonuclease n=1 Tax=Reyranella sp. TaxID=1929291 RepID=UPI003D0BF3CB
MPLPRLPTRLKPVDTRKLKPPPKTVDPHYQSPEHRAWAATVIDRAGGRCEFTTGGLRCTRARPAHRMFANHKVERRDGGAPLDPANGECLCGSHHTRVTMQARARRHGLDR